MITAYRAWSTRRRRSNNDGRNDPVGSFGIRSSRSPARGRQHSRSVTITLPGSGVAALVGFGTDHRGQLGLDQRLVDGCRRLPDPVGQIGLLDRIQDFEQGRLRQGDRVDLLRVELGGYTQRLTRWPLHVSEAAPGGLRHPRGRHPPLSVTTCYVVTEGVLRISPLA